MKKSKTSKSPVILGGRDRIAEAEASIETYKIFTADHDGLVEDFEQAALKLFGCFPIKPWQNNYTPKQAGKTK